MTALLWMLALLPHVLAAMIKFPPPVNITLTSSHFEHVLRWEPGPGTPTGVYYHVTIITQTGTGWVLVPGCEHVQYPLVCNLTEAFFDRKQVYYTKLSALLDSKPEALAVVTQPAFQPIKETALDLPLLTVTPCGKDLCVDHRPTVEHLRASYDSLYYTLRVTSNNADKAQFFVDTQSLGRVILKDLASGRQYCVSIRIFDRKVPRESNYSQPVCASTPAHSTPDPWISASLCFLVMCVLVVLALLIYTGSICLSRRPLPPVLTSIHHTEEELAVPSCNSSLSSLLNLELAAPPSGRKSSSHSSDESDEEESVTEKPGWSRGGGYQLRGGTNPLSSSSSSSSSECAPLSPQQLPEQTSVHSIPQPDPSPPAETCTSAGLQPAPASPTDTHCSTTGTKVEGEGGSQEVNFFTLTFGSLGEEGGGKSHFDTVEVGSEGESQTVDTQEVAIQTVSCSGDEEKEEEEEEEEEYSGYMRR
ncbi:hypothetical protein PBY51_022893 [Eleginops maclovinus]|uniref:Uncharacterized protein n=1 Tax=Eleginops maclovinus TaxID=56733 RepID=A0AAN7XIE6_ELEMC|nr:hypothetical protein PBY51_022893 [Eleginops maclovinus]